MCLGSPLNFASRTFAKPQKPSMPLIWTASFAELIVGMIDAEVAIAEIDQTVVAAPAIGVDDSAEIHPAAVDALEGWPRAVRDDLGVDLALTLEDAEDDAVLP